MNKKQAREDSMRTQFSNLGVSVKNQDVLVRVSEETLNNEEIEALNELLLCTIKEAKHQASIDNYLLISHTVALTAGAIILLTLLASYIFGV